jgi:glycosyltransferase involved in cell wall biosynthesis
VKRILIVGRYPPPTGGNTVHIQRLAQRLHSDGHHVTVVDLYAIERSSVSEAFPILSRWQGGMGVATLLRKLGVAATGSIAHLHISAGSNFYLVGLPLLWVFRSAHKRVLTIHSGSWVKEFQGLSPLMRRLAVEVLSHFDDLICVNEEQRRVLTTSLVGARTHVIPAYLPCIPSPDTPLVETVAEIREDVEYLIVASGYETPVYGYETLIRGLALAQERLGRRTGLVIATYGTRDPEYWRAIEQLFNQIPVPIVHTRDLCPEEFVRVIAVADMYVRPTTTDGDAVALREAASAGLQILASDATTRPAGTALFRTKDVEDLAKLIVTAVLDSSVGRISRDQLPADFYHDLLEVYNN